VGWVGGWGKECDVEEDERVFFFELFGGGEGAVGFGASVGAEGARCVLAGWGVYFGSMVRGGG